MARVNPSACSLERPAYHIPTGGTKVVTLLRPAVPCWPVRKGKLASILFPGVCIAIGDIAGLTCSRSPLQHQSSLEILQVPPVPYFIGMGPAQSLSHHRVVAPYRAEATPRRRGTSGGCVGVWAAVFWRTVLPRRDELSVGAIVVEDVYDVRPILAPNHESAIKLLVSRKDPALLTRWAADLIAHCTSPKWSKGGTYGQGASLRRRRLWGWRPRGCGCGRVGRGWSSCRNHGGRGNLCGYRGVSGCESRGCSHQKGRG